ncbi:MAG: hypothetical protein KKA73_23270 [Chloroflexi bacterium]|nr:hypothetical protein [Chloroflexota bacterium]MBU1750612.1 hypothetical protein [Chloroflexota bacterium]
MSRKWQLIILGVVTVLVVGGGVACACSPFATTSGVSVSTPQAQVPTTAPGQPTTKPAVQPTQPSVDNPNPPPLGSTAITSLRFMFESKSSTGETMQVEGAQTASAMYMKMTQINSDGTSESQALYYVGEFMYYQEGEEWQKIEVGATPTFSIDDFDFNKTLKEAQDNGTLQLKPAGVGTVRGVACAKYDFVSTEGETTGTGSIYQGITDGLLYRMEGESKGTDGTTSQVVAEFWDYNQNFSIEPPI